MTHEDVVSFLRQVMEEAARRTETSVEQIRVKVTHRSDGSSDWDLWIKFPESVNTFTSFLGWGGTPEAAISDLVRQVLIYRQSLRNGSTMEA